MKITVLFFGISSDLVGENQLEVTLEKAISVADFKDYLQEKYSSLDKIKTYAIALNESYATNDLVIKDNDVVAVIPPVSGG
ncbi:MoaD/ThiS family protein [Polaribacter dokdonensis]|uniref:Molybdopterin synthase sulfur carrier subunit n=1 Tax=Polaribacter dokdonensis DSW-5 TaxID=1300348 RepID=A0A0M9CGA2_9FLAO|nr:MoaD/ThiS family protein [Polaribacter dokdonensis]KOY52041.1 Molybdopterin converting factor subunit 1 [Polaribacter dokdonensis DSW-5]SED97076.1 molybdopterin synthase catalytic subunit/molybdopterin synthase sulfur carrier subunit [Polaribacter dokdonensis DSW-5]